LNISKYPGFPVENGDGNDPVALNLMIAAAPQVDEDDTNLQVSFFFKKDACS
jgi:hypothetical protein